MDETLTCSILTSLMPWSTKLGLSDFRDILAERILLWGRGGYQVLGISSMQSPEFRLLSLISENNRWIELLPLIRVE